MHSKKRRKVNPKRELESRLVHIQSNHRNSVGSSPTRFQVDLSRDVNQRIHAVELVALSFTNVQPNVSAGRDRLIFTDGHNDTTIVIGDDEYLDTTSFITRIQERIESAVPSAAPVQVTQTGTSNAPMVQISINAAASGILVQLLPTALATRLGFVSTTLGPIFKATSIASMTNPLTAVNINSEALTRMSPNIRGDGHLSDTLMSIPVTRPWGTNVSFVSSSNRIPDVRVQPNQLYHLENVDLSLTDQDGKDIAYMHTASNVTFVLRIWY